MRYFFLLVTGLIVVQGCSTVQPEKKTARKKEKETQKKVSKTSKSKPKTSSKGSLGLNPKKGINGAFVEEDFSMVGKRNQKKRNLPRKPEDANLKSSPKKDFEYLFNTQPIKVDGPPKKVSSQKKQVSGGQQTEPDSESQLDFDVAELDKRFKTELDSLRGKQVYVRGVVVSAGVEPFEKRFQPTLVLSEKLTKDEPNSKSSDSPKQPCVFLRTTDLMLTEPGRSVVVRGTVHGSKTLVGCKLIATEGDLIPRTTAPDLARSFNSDTNRFKKQLVARQILLRGTVKSVSNKQAIQGYEMSVVLNGTDNLLIGLHATQANQKLQFAKLKPDQEIIVIGRIVVADPSDSQKSLKLGLRDATRIDLVSKPSSPSPPQASKKQ